VITRIDDNLQRIHVDSRQIEQVLVNLYLNAIDAMPGGGTLTIEAKRARDGVSITVADTGFGIEDKDLPKIFQPFLLRRRRPDWVWACRFVTGSSRIMAVRSR